MAYLETDAGDQLTTDSGDFLITDPFDATTFTTLTAAPPPPVVHATTVILTATVTSDSSGATGTVEFRDAGILLGTGTISGTTATYSTNALDVGTHSLTATYLGDASYGGSTSSALSYTIVAPDTPPDQPPKPSKPTWGRPKVKDYSALLFDPVFGELGVPAVFTAVGTAGEVEITVIDDTRRKIQASNSVEVHSVGPGAFARIPELTAKGIARETYKGSTLTFNGRSWEVRSYELTGSPNGEDLGQVRFLLMAV